MLAKLISLLKANDPDVDRNYRPISLLNFFNKLLEKIVYRRALNILSQNNFLSSFQFGFRSLHSTEAAIHILISNVYDAFNNNLFCMSIFLDLSKAFDSIDRNIALEKLHYYGFRGTIFKWFKSYFSNRR